MSQKPVWSLPRLEAFCALLCPMALEKINGRKGSCWPRSDFSPGTLPASTKTGITQRKARCWRLSGKKKQKQCRLKFLGFQGSIGLEIWFICVAGPSGSLLCMCFQYWVPVQGLCIWGTGGKARGSFGNYLANLMIITHQMSTPRKSTPGYKLFCLFVCTDHVDWVRAKIYSLCEWRGRCN